MLRSYHIGCWLGFSLVLVSAQSRPTTESLESIPFDANNIVTYMTNNGHFSHAMASGGSGGTEWPAGSGKAVIFNAGLVVAGEVNGEQRTAAALSASSWSPGYIFYNTITQQPRSSVPLNTDAQQIYRVQKGDSPNPSDPSYSQEYADWPATEGAPAHDGEYFSDLNGNGGWNEGEPFEDFDLDGNYDGPNGILITGEDPPRFFGDDQAWFVMNGWDRDTQAGFWEGLPFGVEAQVLVYAIDDPILQDVLFYRILLVNKGGQAIDNLRVGVYIDPDIGDANDDYVGCDPEYNLGFAYNDTSDMEYGAQPPSVAFAFLNKPLTVFTKMAGGSMFWSEPTSTQEVINLLSGKNAQGFHWSDVFSPIPDAHLHFWGDPVFESGWTETANGSTPSEVKMLLSTNQQSMPLWDDLNADLLPDEDEPGVLLLESALIVSAGMNNLNAISKVRYLGNRAKAAIGGTIDTPVIQPPPMLTVASSYKALVLDWREGAAEYESALLGKYEFEGYEVYQGESINGPWIKIATQDLDNEISSIETFSLNDEGQIVSDTVHSGPNSGITHSLHISADALTSGAELESGRKYYFALKGYAYSDMAYPNTIESELRTAEGETLSSIQNYLPQEQLFVVHDGQADAQITISVENPSELTGLKYSLTFNYDEDSQTGYAYVLRNDADTVWSQSWTYLEYRLTWRKGLNMETPAFIDGFGLDIQNLIFGLPSKNDSWDQIVSGKTTTYESGRFLAVYYDGINTPLWADENKTRMIDLSTICCDDEDTYQSYEVEYLGNEIWIDLIKTVYQGVVIRTFAEGLGYGGKGGDRLSDIPGYGGGSQSLTFLRGDLELRFSGTYKATYMHIPVAGMPSEIRTIPFAVWDIENDVQRAVAHVDWNQSGSMRALGDGYSNYALDGDWIIVYELDYDTYQDSIQELDDNPDSGWCWSFYFGSEYTPGDRIRMHFINPVNPGEDVYTWDTKWDATSVSNDQVPNQLALWTFPNPFNPSTTIRYELASQVDVSLQIFDIRGRLVKTLMDQSLAARSYTTQWNGLDQQGKQVGTGVYYARLTAGDYTQVVKMVLLR